MRSVLIELPGAFLRGRRVGWPNRSPVIAVGIGKLCAFKTVIRPV